MSTATGIPRRRIGRVSIFQHHGSYYTYHRCGRKPIRKLVGASSAAAECQASLLNARLVAEQAGLNVEELAQLIGVGSRRTDTTGCNLSEPGVSVPELRRLFLDHHEHVLKSATSTVSRYSAATAYLERYVKRERINNAADIDVAEFITYLRTFDVTPNGHPHTAHRRLMDKGVRYVLESCRSMYRFGFRLRHLPRQIPNPFEDAGIGALKIRDAKPVFVFSAEQELQFFRQCDFWSFAVHFTLAKTGLRPGELTHLLIEDLDLDQGWLWVRRKPELGWTPKTNAERRVPLVPEVIELLRHIIRGRRTGPVFLRSQFRPPRTPSLIGDRAALARAVSLRLAHARQQLGRDLTRPEESKVFRGVWREAGAVNVNRIRILFIRVARSAGLAATCPKSWRHTFATLLQDGEVDPLIRQETLGHRTALRHHSALGMTGVYTHTRPETLRRQILRALCLRPQALALVQELLLSRSDKEVSNVSK